MMIKNKKQIMIILINKIFKLMVMIKTYKKVLM